MAQRVLQAAKQALGVLAHHRFAVALARVAQHYPQHPAATRLAILMLDRRSQSEINLHLLPGLAFHAPHPLRLPCLKPAHKATNRLIGG